MAWERKFIECGAIEFTNSSVRVYSRWPNDNVNLPNVPSGVVNAYWQGTNVMVELSDGWTYVYADGPYKDYTSRFRRSH